MNHDVTHCMDQDNLCPKNCYRAELNEDYRKRYLDFMGRPVSWAHLRGAPECPRRTVLDEADQKGGGIHG